MASSDETFMCLDKNKDDDITPHSDGQNMLSTEKRRTCTVEQPHKMRSFETDDNDATYSMSAYAYDSTNVVLSFI